MRMDNEDRCFEEYLAGYVYGDGNLYYDKKKRSYRIRLYDSPREYVEWLANKIKEKYGVRPSITRRKNENLYSISFYSKKMYVSLQRIINELYINPSLCSIRGILDAEGYCYLRKRGSNVDVEIGIANKDLELLERIMEEFQRHNVRASLAIRKFHDPDRYVGYIRVYGLKNVYKLITLIPPYHPRFNKVYEILKPALPPP
jgi:intein-encoded DNA endonuclease-like protein